MFNFRTIIPLLILALPVMPAIAEELPDSTLDNRAGEERTFISATESMGMNWQNEDAQTLKGRIYANYTGRKYILGPNDIISIDVYDAPEFSHEDILIQPDGNITVAPFGSLQLAGKTMEEVQLDLADRLKYYLNDPKVTIKLEHSKPFTVYVSGAVLKPGSYEMVTDVFRNQLVADNTPEVLLERKAPLLSNVLVAAGGIRYDADLEHVVIRNKIDGSEYQVNLLELIQTGDSANDLFLIAGDSVHIPKLSSPYAVDEEKYRAVLGSTIFQRDVPIKVYGFVNQPGLVRLESAQSANLNSAIAAAGGFLNENNGSASYAPDHVLVSRVDANGHIATTKVDPRKEDMTLRPNDIVYVPDKARPRVGKAFDFLTRIITPIAGIANAGNNWALLFDPGRFNLNYTGR